MVHSWASVNAVDSTTNWRTRRNISCCLISLPKCYATKHRVVSTWPVLSDIRTSTSCRQNSEVEVLTPAAINRTVSADSSSNFNRGSHWSRKMERNSQVWKSPEIDHQSSEMIWSRWSWESDFITHHYLWISFLKAGLKLEVLKFKLFCTRLYRTFYTVRKKVKCPSLGTSYKC